MNELPEAVVLADQLNRAVRGKVILSANANQSPHKFAWYTGDPAEYNDRLAGKTIGEALPYAGQVEVKVEDRYLLLSALLRLYAPGEKLPPKHQLHLLFTDEFSLVATIQMWGGLLCFKEGEKANFEDYAMAKVRPSPLAEAFDRAYFDSLFDETSPRLSVKEFLATRQRIPGLGNGVLQDILWTAKLHPRRKMGSLSPEEVDAMFKAVKIVLSEMTRLGGRDTERDLFGCPGGYRTVLSKNTIGSPCPQCGTEIKKEAYLGGNIYWCGGCQQL